MFNSCSLQILNDVMWHHMRISEQPEGHNKIQQHMCVFVDVYMEWQSLHGKQN